MPYQGKDHIGSRSYLLDQLCVVVRARNNVELHVERPQLFRFINRTNECSDVEIWIILFEEAREDGAADISCRNCGGSVQMMILNIKYLFHR
jgi:hypothetical protein